MQRTLGKSLASAAAMVAADVFGLWGAGNSRRQRRFVGKRYSASVRQHQRNARKLRNRKATR